MKRLEERIKQLKDLSEEKYPKRAISLYSMLRKRQILQAKEDLQIINDLQAIIKKHKIEDLKATIVTHIPQNNLVSNCCGAGEYHGVIDKYNTGRCSKCGDGAEFVSEEDFYN